MADIIWQIGSNLSAPNCLGEFCASWKEQVLTPRVKYGFQNAFLVISPDVSLLCCRHLMDPLRLYGTALAHTSAKEKSPMLKGSAPVCHHLSPRCCNPPEQKFMFSFKAVIQSETASRSPPGCCYCGPSRRNPTTSPACQAPERRRIHRSTGTGRRS